MGLPQLPATEDESSVLVSYDSWLLKHPSALDTFNQLLSIARGKKIVVCLDYDGTLSNIVDNPEKAFMTDKMRMVLREVARHFPTAIISGRGREKVSDFVDLDNVYYAGSHGLDIAAPLRSPTYGDPKHQSRALDRKGNEVVLFQPAKKYLPAIEKILGTLNEKTRSIQGVMIENNKFCVSVHFRHVRDEDFCTLEKLVNSVLQEYEEFRISIGKKVFEIRPDMEWNKGHALNYFIDTLGLGSSNDVLPLYIGDDRTDEDAFKAIRNRGEGFPIVVSSSPKDTAALYSLRNPLEVNKFLINLVRWRKNSSSSKSFRQNLEGKTRIDWLLTPTSCTEQRTFDPLYSVGMRYWDCKTLCVYLTHSYKEEHTKSKRRKLEAQEIWRILLSKLIDSL